MPPMQLPEHPRRPTAACLRCRDRNSDATPWCGRCVVGISHPFVLGEPLMATHDLVKTLHELKMPAMAASLMLQFDDPASEERTFEDRLASLLRAECLRRADERAERFLRLAKCPAMADLALWQANGRTGLKRSMIDSLASCAWV